MFVEEVALAMIHAVRREEIAFKQVAHRRWQGPVVLRELHECILVRLAVGAG